MRTCLISIITSQMKITGSWSVFWPMHACSCALNTAPLCVIDASSLLANCEFQASLSLLQFYRLFCVRMPAKLTKSSINYLRSCSHCRLPLHKAIRQLTKAHSSIKAYFDPCCFSSALQWH